ncbi:unnamed protein product, partial [Discosporangium mesarthrocarpum]
PKHQDSAGRGGRDSCGDNTVTTVAGYTSMTWSNSPSTLRCHGSGGAHGGSNSAHGDSDRTRSGSGISSHPSEKEEGLGFDEGDSGDTIPLACGGGRASPRIVTRSWRRPRVIRAMGGYVEEVGGRTAAGPRGG